MYHSIICKILGTSQSSQSLYERPIRGPALAGRYGDTCYDVSVTVPMTDVCGDILRNIPIPSYEEDKQSGSAREVKY